MSVLSANTITVMTQDSCKNIYIPLDELVPKMAYINEKARFIDGTVIDVFNNFSLKEQLEALDAQYDIPKTYNKLLDVSKVFKKGAMATLDNTTYYPPISPNSLSTRYFFKIDDGLKFFAEIENTKSGDKIISLQPMISIEKEKYIKEISDTFEIPGSIKEDEVSQHSGNIFLKEFYDKKGIFNISKNKYEHNWISRNLFNKDFSLTIYIGCECCNKYTPLLEKLLTT